MSVEASGLKEDRKKVFKKAFFMAGGTLTSRVLGLFRDMALAALFDRTVTDAWTAAFRLPNLFRRLFGEGSLSVSFIPVFIESQAEDTSGVRARNLINAIYTLLLIVLGVVTLWGIGSMESLLRLLLADNYLLDVEKWNLTVRMARIMFGFVFFVCSYAYFMGILNALGSFALPALAPALLNISMLIFTFMPPQWFPQMGDGLAWGVFVGGLLQAVLLWWALRHRNYLPRITRHLWNPDVRLVLKNMLPGLLGMGLLQLATLVNLHFASGLGEGALSYIYWADRLLELPLSLVAVSIGAALLPTLSDLAQRKEREQFQKVMQEHFLMNLFLAVPAAIGLYFLARPIVEVLFYRGHFAVSDVAATSMVLQVYAVSLLFVSSVRVLIPSFYAVKNTWVPAVTSLIGLALHIGIAPFWIRSLGLQGLVISSLVAAAVQFVLVVALMGRFAVQMRWMAVGKELFKILIAGALMAVVAWGLAGWITYASSSLIKTLLLTLVMGLCALVYGISSLKLKIEQGSFLLDQFKRKNKS
ncbi:murein biosynthesis integral membrane protein MurJ [Bdellovibrio sp. SKB1291214]|uniref:murein biosynthesis integral membrane protein MurJ n=1 Tax=Bdellovibrio sp. SKB1291214 TaxID=1732569 RepID=UPI000B51A92E|nr:murein biosynthesis integral membrane protein MurJ [Bdellovibrio sp. SKB1291214]UYL09233.1 murein biosynthesis integral membrane protein MurJ [Bdellovibrio sp. SKB1291214]